MTATDSPETTAPIIAVGTAIIASDETRTEIDTVTIPAAATVSPSAATIRQIIGTILFTNPLYHAAAEMSSELRAIVLTI